MRSLVLCTLSCSRRYHCCGTHVSVCDNNSLVFRLNFNFIKATPKDLMKHKVSCAVCFVGNRIVYLTCRIISFLFFYLSLYESVEWRCSFCMQKWFSLVRCMIFAYDWNDRDDGNGDDDVFDNSLIFVISCVQCVDFTNIRRYEENRWVKRYR